jgi:hypothetical protein
MTSISGVWPSIMFNFPNVGIATGFDKGSAIARWRCITNAHQQRKIPSERLAAHQGFGACIAGFRAGAP